MLRQLGSTFVKKSTLKEKILLFCIIQFWGQLIPAYIAYPIWFRSPEIFCLDSKSNEFKSCPRESFCLKNHSERKYSMNNFNSTFNMVCDEDFGVHSRDISSSIILFGAVFGVIFNFLVNIPNIKARKFTINFIGFAVAISLLVATFVSPNLILISCILSVMTFSVGSVYGHAMAFINEKFNEDFAKICPTFMNASFSLSGAMFALMAYFFNCNWKILAIYQSAVFFFWSFLFYFTKLERNGDPLLENYDTELLEVFILF